MKTLNKMLTIIAIMLLSTSFIACEAEEYPHKANTPTTIGAPVTGNIVPDWLEGVYLPDLYPNEDVSYINENKMHLNFAPYSQDVYYFSIIDTVTEETANTFTVHYTDSITIIFRKNTNTILTNVHITFIDGGVIYDFGWFNKI